MYKKLVREYINLDYKFTPFFWNQFCKKQHYFKGSVQLEELKLFGYLNFLKNIKLSEDFVLKTDLYVEAKNRSDNFLPYLKINEIIGMDISLEVVKMARTNLARLLPDMKFVVADIRHLPFKEHSFSAIISDSTLDHIPKSDLVKALLELKRILKNNGKLLLSLNNIFNFPFVCDSYIKNLFFYDYFIGFSFSPRYIFRLLESLGFKMMNWDYIIRLDYFGLFLIKLYNRIKIINPLVRGWLSIIIQFSNPPFLKKFFSLQFITFAKKLEE